ncbi:GH25219 [Drosophila grimshawi]|uniref:GH25219 n=1 Tax=Drosophila grimshawi TaxID=7222 RepID=B4K1F0_DROGR|nr:GH25219 [Drosophila grimshawi]
MERQQQLDDITAMNTSLQAGYNVAIHHLQNITQQSQIELAEQLKKNEDLSVELITVENQKRAQFDAYQAELAPMEHFKKRYEELRKGNEKSKRLLHIEKQNHLKTKNMLLKSAQKLVKLKQQYKQNVAALQTDAKKKNDKIKAYQDDLAEVS